MFGSKTQKVSKNKKGKIPDIEVNLSEEISSARYPLTEKWLMMVATKRLVGSFFLTFFIFVLIPLNDLGIFEQDNLVFIFLSFFAVVSGMAFWQIFSIARWRAGFEYTFNRTDIAYKIKGRELSLSYKMIKRVKIRRGLIDRLFGYSVLWINQPTQEQLQRQKAVLKDMKNKKTFSFLAIRGLKKEDAKHIERFLSRNVLSHSIIANNSRANRTNI